jgi:hypothetical protein
MRLLFCMRLLCMNIAVAISVSMDPHAAFRGTRSSWSSLCSAMRLNPSSRVFRRCIPSELLLQHRTLLQLVRLCFRISGVCIGVYKKALLTLPLTLLQLSLSSTHIGASSGIERAAVDRRDARKQSCITRCTLAVGHIRLIHAETCAQPSSPISQALPINCCMLG